MECPKCEDERGFNPDLDIDFLEHGFDSATCGAVTSDRVMTEFGGIEEADLSQEEEECLEVQSLLSRGNTDFVPISLCIIAKTRFNRGFCYLGKYCLIFIFKPI